MSGSKPNPQGGAYSNVNTEGPPIDISSGPENGGNAESYEQNNQQTNIQTPEGLLFVDFRRKFQFN